LREGAYYEASKALEQAIDLDEGFALAHARLAEAWTELDYEDRAKDELLRVASLVPDRSSLPERDALYLRAITETLTRNLGSAIETYRAILDRAPETEKPFAYVDLGRAYEKGEDVKRALECYVEAGRRDSQLASAFLRAGIVHGRQHELDQALQAFGTTQRIYEALSRTEGTIEVLYQRGVLFSNADRLRDARGELERALDMTSTSGNTYQRIRVLLQLSNLSCFESDTSSAERYAAQAMSLAKENGMENLTTQGLVDLGRSFFLRDKFTEGEKYFMQALEYAQSHKGLRSKARAQLSLASVRIQQDKADEALQYVGPALEFFESGGYSKEYLQCLSILGQAHDLKSDYESALQAYQRQNELALRVGNPSQTAFSHNGIGLMLSYGEDYPTALRHFEESYRIYESLKYWLYAGYSLINHADMLSRLGRYRDAQQALNRASSIAERADESYRQLSGGILLVSARTALSQRRFAEARNRAQKALSLAITRSPHSAVEAQSILGSAMSFTGAGSQGIVECQRAVDTARTLGSERLLSIAQLALAEASLERRDARNAVVNALQAQSTFESAGRLESEWRSWLIAARASLETGDRDATRKYLSRASGLLSLLQQKWGDEMFSVYSERPDVQLCRRQLTQILANSQ
jgi:tetratricopeptide (TPR) repeat protein